MGLSDRDYGRESSFGGGYGQSPGIHLDGPLTVTTKLVLITAGVYVLQLAVAEFTNLFVLFSDWYRAPWHGYRLLTYGFLHDRGGINHILINMLVLWMFGRDLERKYGTREFVWFYLTGIVLAGLGWSLFELTSGGNSALLGASGGVSAVFALYALNYPYRKVLFMFIIPMPIWIAALIGILYDINLTMDRTGRIAGSAHLAGALFGLYYYKFGFSPGRWLADQIGSKTPRRKPKLRVHHPDEAEGERSSATEDRLNAILQKIHEQGQESLTRSEKRFLEKTSKEFQNRRR